LLDTNQEDKAAVLKVREGDFLQAISLFLKGGMPGRAAQVILDHDLQQPLQLLDSVATALARAGMHDKAGEFYERLNELPRALDSYVRGNAFRKAVELARKCFPAKVVQLQEQWGDFLVTQKQIDMAINHFIEAKVYLKAIEAALNAKQFARALQLVDAIDIETARPYYKQLARYYEDARQYEAAEKCFVAAGQPQLAVEMHTKLGHWEVAHKIATSYMKEGEVALLYINQAQKLEDKSRLKEAEKLYLAVNEKDLAINMYKKHKRYEDMIRLVKQYRADLLKETHQFLGQTLEMENSLREAEHHYVEAQEWHSAVSMYRSNELWDDAIRVAKFYGGVSACKRVTIALLMAIGVSEGTKYLTKHGLVEAAIEHATENGAFDMALELANYTLPKKLPDIHLKHALFLEDDERFREAEDEFIKASKPKEAIDMYLHQHDWENAVRVAERYDPSAIADIFIAQAKLKVDAAEYRAAEELYLNASRPELALAMYQEHELWQEASRLAQLHLPHRAAEVMNSYQTAQARAGKGHSRNDFMSMGRSLEQSKQWAQAIDMYLGAKVGKVDNLADLEEIWERAVEVARSYVPNRHVEVSLEISRRLVEVAREEAAADILFEVNRQDEAIGLLLGARKYDKAKALAKGNAALKRKVEDAYQAHLVAREDTKELFDLGAADVALDVLAKRGDWERVWEMASKEKMSLQALGKYILMRLDELLRRNRAEDRFEAVKLLSRKSCPVHEQSVAMIRRLVLALLGCNSEQEDGEHAQCVSLLRDILYKLANSSNAAASNGSSASQRAASQELLELLMAMHYSNMIATARQLGMKDLVAKCSITLLKYPDLVPPDKAYYKAGLACREQGNSNLAFLLLNRYVDITEAMDAADPSLLDNSDLQDADALPAHIDALPAQHYLAHEEDREEVRTWVLSVVTDSSIDQRLPSRDAVRNTLYEGLFLASGNKPACIVTGFPVQPADLLEVNNSTANRRDWNALVNKTRMCPWTGQPQNPLY
jgi:intraflagellar transport protein 172